MKITFKILLTPLLVILPGLSYGQGYISSDYMPASTLKDDAGNKYGSGDLLILSGRYTLPFSVRHNEKGQVTAWSATLNCSYGILNNKGPAKELNPDNILNSSLNISHIRPLSDRWSIIASLGAGVYASPNEITMKSVLANGAVVFVYKLRNNLDLGIGGGLTNSYGIPMILPMIYFSWRNTGKYEFKVDMSSGIKISAATWLNKKFKVELTAIEMDGMSAVMNIDGKSKIYSTASMKSYISPSFYISKKTSIYLGIGGNWIRSAKISDRSFKGFIENFKEDDGSCNFGTSLRFTAGFRGGF